MSPIVSAIIWIVVAIVVLGVVWYLFKKQKSRGGSSTPSA